MVKDEVAGWGAASADTTTDQAFLLTLNMYRVPTDDMSNRELLTEGHAVCASFRAARHVLCRGGSATDAHAPELGRRRRCPLRRRGDGRVVSRPWTIWGRRRDDRFTTVVYIVTAGKPPKDRRAGLRGLPRRSVRPWKLSSCHGPHQPICTGDLSNRARELLLPWSSAQRQARALTGKAQAQEP